MAKRSDADTVLTKRQCYITEDGKQHCINEPTCTKREDGSVVCVKKRDAEELQKRQCYVDEEGEQHCIDKPTCYKQEDGSVVCVAK